MASKGNKIEGWEPNPWTAATNANVANEQTMTSPEAQAARAKSAEGKSLLESLVVVLFSFVYGII